MLGPDYGRPKTPEATKVVARHEAKVHREENINVPDTQRIIKQVSSQPNVPKQEIEPSSPAVPTSILDVIRKEQQKHAKS